jgi:hypothetical protein
MNMVSSKAFLFYLINNIEYKYPHSEKFLEVFHHSGLLNKRIWNSELFFGKEHNIFRLFIESSHHSD